MEQNLNLYQIFYMVARCKSISSAAGQLYISQPAVSKAVHKLETNLHTALFQRSSRGVHLTETGEILYEQVHTAMNALDLGEAKLKEMIPFGISNLSIGVSATLCKYVLLPFLKDFMTQYPNIHITISCQSTFETIRAIENAAIDIGLVGLPDVENLPSVPLMNIHDIFVAAPSYTNMTSMDKPLEPRFRDASFILLDKGNISRQHLDSYLFHQQIALPHVIEVNNMDLSIEFAKKGLGIACVIQEFVEEDIKNKTLCELSLSHPIPNRKIGFVYEKDSILTTQMKYFMEYYQHCQLF